jgi:hypothetical protein
MPSFRVSTRIDNPRFRVIFDEDNFIRYCNSFKSLALILEEHRRFVGVRRLSSVVGPDDRRGPRPTRREFSFEGVRITRFQYPRARPRPTHRTSNVFEEPAQDDDPPSLRAYFDHVRAGNGVTSPRSPAYLEHLAREWWMNHARLSSAITPVPPRFIPPQSRERNLVTVLHNTLTPAHAPPPRRASGL